MLKDDLDYLGLGNEVRDFIAKRCSDLRESVWESDYTHEEKKVAVRILDDRINSIMLAFNEKLFKFEFKNGKSFFVDLPFLCVGEISKVSRFAVRGCEEQWIDRKHKDWNYYTNGVMCNRGKRAVDYQRFAALCWDEWNTTKSTIDRLIKDTKLLFKADQLIRKSRKLVYDANLLLSDARHLKREI